MKLSRERKILAGILGFGLLAVVVDRFGVGYGATGPETAGAAMVVDSTSVVIPTSLTHTEQAAPSQAFAEIKLTESEYPTALADQLASIAMDQGLTASDELSDVFDSVRIMPVVENPQFQAKVEQKKQFHTQHRLDAIIAGQGRTIVLVDGQPMQQGDRLADGYQLVEIDQKKGEVVFVAGTDRAVLTISPDVTSR